jgi:hypothetical protein
MDQGDADSVKESDFEAELNDSDELLDDLLDVLPELVPSDDDDSECECDDDDFVAGEATFNAGLARAAASSDDSLALDWHPLE